MILPLIVLLLVVAYVILDRSGVLEEFLKSIRQSRQDWPPSPPEMENAPPQDEDSERRLEVFEDFIEGLDSNPDDEDEPPPA